MATETKNKGNPKEAGGSTTKKGLFPMISKSLLSTITPQVSQGLQEMFPSKRRITDDDLKAKFGQLETGAQIQLDRGDDLKMRDVESIETMSEDGVETFRLIILEDGDSVFVDDVMLAVTRQRGENIPPEEDK